MSVCPAIAGSHIHWKTWQYLGNSIRQRYGYYRPLIGSYVMCGLLNSVVSIGIQWPLRSFTYYESFQMQFLVDFCSNSLSLLHMIMTLLQTIITNSQLWSWRQLSLLVFLYCCYENYFVLWCVVSYTGAFVAGLDAGLVYNTYPMMADRWIPSDIFALTPKWKNIFDNGTTAQFNHRHLVNCWLLAFT